MSIHAFVYNVNHNVICNEQCLESFVSKDSLNYDNV